MTKAKPAKVLSILAGKRNEEHGSSTNTLELSAIESATCRSGPKAARWRYPPLRIVSSQSVAPGVVVTNAVERDAMVTRMRAGWKRC